MTDVYTIVAPQELNAAIDLPASKSISNRALILHALSKSLTEPRNLSICDDTIVMINAFLENHEVVDIKAAGTAMRFLTAYYSILPGKHILTGTERMQQRPIRILVDALRTLGADIQYMKNEGFPPLLIQGGELKSKAIELAGNISSQYISALLMIGPTLPHGLTLNLTGNIVSRPYINLTLRLMVMYGAKADWTDENCIQVEPGGYKDTSFIVENDWSAASYWYEMLALSQNNGLITLKGLMPHSNQGDSRGAEIFSKLGIKTEITEEGAILKKVGIPVCQLSEDLVDIPDLAQTFVVTCCLMGIPFRFTGLQSLKIKETDRIVALQHELRKIGFVVKDTEDSILYWDGERCEEDEDPIIRTYEDHRMAMAFAPICLKRRHIRIEHPEVVSKSYPTYWDNLSQAQFNIKKCSY